MRAFFALLLTVTVLAAQPPAPEALRQDSKALSLLKRADELTYAPSRAGLKDLAYEHRLSRFPGFHIVVKWKAGRVAADIVVTDKKQPGLEQAVAAQTPFFVKMASQVTDFVVGKPNLDAYAADEIHFVEPNKVKVVARSKDSLATFKENLITFDDRGLPVSMMTSTGKGELPMSVTFGKKKELWIVERLSSGPVAAATEMTFSYQEVDGFFLPSRIAAKGPAGPHVQEFSAFKVNAGIDDSVFSNSSNKKNQ